MATQKQRDKWDAEERRERDLLEAAPEMLEALQIVRITLQQIIKNNPLNIAAKNDLQRIEAAIQKAEGEK